MQRLTRVGLMVLIGLLVTAAPAMAEPFAEQGWSKSPNYLKASAHDPMFNDRSLWPQWVEKSAFVKEEWPKARVLVWAHAGKTMRGKFDMTDPANWLEDGKPATRGPDKETDIVFPTAEKRYGVNDGKGCDCRHMTVESGVSAFLKSVSVHGNMWIKEGASWHSVNVRGNRDTFMRNDAATPNLAANKIAFNKTPDKSIEWIGNWKIGDELDLFSGRFIVAPDSIFMPGDRSTQHIYEKATLVLLSGSSFYKRGNQYWGNDMVIQGTILVGTPDRPLTQDATIGFSFKNKGVGDVSKFSSKGDLGLILYKEGTIAVHSSDPAQHKLIFNWHRQPASSGAPKGGKEPADVAALDHGIDMLLIGRTDFNGVEFRDILKGGIRLPDPDARKKWNNVSFGQGNFGEEGDLIVKYDGPTDLKWKPIGVAKDVIEAKGIEAGGGSD
jgi:hypothetical protein